MRCARSRLSGFNSLQALDASPCRPFDQDRKGLNLGEGSAVLVLETLERALERNADILAVLRGWAMSNDAFHPTAPQEQGNGLAACAASAMEMAEVSSDEIGYVNAHGTGTPLNDIAEAKAYETAFRGRSRAIPVSSTKSYFGHCLGAAGALEAAITIIAIRCGVLIPTLRLTNPIDSPAVDWLSGESSATGASTGDDGFGGIWWQQRRAHIREQPPMTSDLPNNHWNRFREPLWSARWAYSATSIEPSVITAWPTAGVRRAFLVKPFRPASVVPGLKTRRLDRLPAWALVASALAIKDAGIDLGPSGPVPSCRGLRHRVRLCRTDRSFLPKRCRQWLVRNRS